MPALALSCLQFLLFRLRCARLFPAELHKAMLLLHAVTSWPGGGYNVLASGIASSGLSVDGSAPPRKRATLPEPNIAGVSDGQDCGGTYALECANLRPDGTPMSRTRIGNLWASGTQRSALVCWKGWNSRARKRGRFLPQLWPISNRNRSAASELCGLRARFDPGA